MNTVSNETENKVLTMKYTLNKPENETEKK